VIGWALWSIETVLSYHIYKRQVRGDLAKYAEEVAAATGCVAITLILIGRSMITDLPLLAVVEGKDVISAILALIVLVIYRRALKKGEVWPATVAFQFLLIFSALPIARSAYENPGIEPLLPWAMWAAGFFMQMLCVMMRRNDKLWWRELITPTNYWLWHLLIAAIVLVQILQS
jgi:hypothetical protein